MSWVYFVFGAIACWGLYGPALHRGQMALGNPLRALLCVGIAYVLIAVLVPLVTLPSQGQRTGLTKPGVMAAPLGGALGAAGAVCIIWAFRVGGSPEYVMPLVFAGAPVINVLYSMWQHPPKTAPSPMLYLGFLLAALGGYFVLHYKPQG